jgi:DNA-binding CsgD family transcriptional regulator
MTTRLDERSRRGRLVLLGAGAVATLLGLEIVTEEGGVSALELLLESLELGLTIAAACAFALLAGRMQAQHEEKLTLLRDLAAARSEGEGFRARVQSHLAGLGAAIDKQFELWSLTEAEREVGLLMLKGFDHKEIAAFRGTSDATVRQQARGIYQKSGLQGLPAFCAFFLEDLLPPAEAAQTGPAGGSQDIPHS